MKSLNNLKNIKIISSFLSFFPKLITKIKKVNFRYIITFPILLFFYIFSHAFAHLVNFKFFPKKIKNKIYPNLSKTYHKIISLLDLSPPGNISEVDLIELSLSNMRTKKTRTFVTIGGMAVGVGIIVFLVSVGYGLQDVVVSRVARLEEMRQTDVSPKTGTHLKLDDKTLSDFQQLQNVNSVLPVIAVVGRISYQKSISDVAVYGVTKDYLNSSAIKPVKGKIFESNNFSVSLDSNQTETGQVAGVTTDTTDTDQTIKYGDVIQEVNFTITPGTWVKIRQDPSVNSPILGFSKREEGLSFGYQVWGSNYLSEDSYGQSGYDEDGKTLGEWVKSTFNLWQETNCDINTDPDCLEGKYLPIRDSDGSILQKEGYTSRININLNQALIEENNSRVLGITTDDDGIDDINTNNSSVNTGSLTLIELSEVSSESAAKEVNKTIKKIDLSNLAEKETVVNRAVLNLLGIEEADAVGKKFEISFVVVGDLLGKDNSKIESNSVEYTIVGVTPEEKTPLIYVPFIDIRSLGLSNFSQVRVVSNDNNSLPKIRQQIEAMGFLTYSVSDTVNQINDLFTTIRTLLIILGMVALFVAALGMFNTLTVSLIERTREVGLMKAIGVKSSEVEQLFLTESILMGVFGGFFGIILGFLLGKLLGLVLSVFAVIKGVGFIDVSTVPLSLVIFISILSLVVGIITGIYPAKRAKKISALNALRYE